MVLLPVRLRRLYMAKMCVGLMFFFSSVFKLQAVPSCPVDRQPFNVVYKRDAVLGCVTVSRGFSTGSTFCFIICKWHVMKLHKLHYSFSHYAGRMYVI